VDRDDRALAIVFAPEHLLRLARVDDRLETVERAGDLLVDGFTGLQPLEQDPEILALLRQPVAERDVLLETAAPLQDLLRLGLVLPEVRRGGLVLQLRELVGGACGVKDSSADRRPASSDPGSAWTGRHE
jgi:hypothetical protein